MYQTWAELLFIHWEVPVEALRPLIPSELAIDTYEGSAWIAITPFTIPMLRPIFVPALPGISSFHETNVRTYVYRNGVPGVWFFSLDANSNFNVLAARTFYRLPYKSAGIRMDKVDRRVSYSLERPATQRARLRAEWTVGEELPQARVDSLEFFLTERYFLYTADGNDIYRCQIHHSTWPLQSAELHLLETDLLSAAGIREPQDPPLVFAGGPVDVEVWPLEKIGPLS
jgi:uncharacterized protein YqjF (DUF2071 family)